MVYNSTMYFCFLFELQYDSDGIWTTLPDGQNRVGVYTGVLSGNSKNRINFSTKLHTDKMRIIIQDGPAIMGGKFTWYNRSPLPVKNFFLFLTFLLLLFTDFFCVD